MQIDLSTETVFEALCALNVRIEFCTKQIDDDRQCENSESVKYWEDKLSKAQKAYNSLLTARV